MNTGSSTRKPISRRDFLKTAGVTLGAGMLACSGLTMLGTRQPLIEFPEDTIGAKMTSNKILVTYASRAGSTAGVAEEIGKTLAEAGVDVDVCHMEKVQDLSAYRAVVAGSAIRGSKWLPEAMQFVQANRAELNSKPFAAFLVCGTLAMPKAEEYRHFVADFLKPVRELVTPLSEGLFAGAVDFSKLALIPDGLSLRLFSTFSKTPEGDYRNWNAIRTWAAQLNGLLGTA